MNAPPSGGGPRRSGSSGGPRRGPGSGTPRDPSRGSQGGSAGRRDRPVPGAGRPAKVPSGPVPPEHADLGLLDRSVRSELRSLSKPKADLVGRHLVAAGEVLDSNPALALEHARAARAVAGRLAAVREAVGVSAYRAGAWAEALTELRAARRMSGSPHNLPLLADCERALGRPEQAIRMLGDPDVRRLDAEARAELYIVVAGARRDQGQLDAALAVLARGGVDQQRPRPGAARLWYAYADVLEALGQREEAASWFAASAALDPDGELDAADRAAALL